MDDHRTTKDWEELIGEQIRDLRLVRNIDQRDMAVRAGIALNAVKRLEGGKGSTLASLIRVLGVLDKAPWLETINPAQPDDAMWIWPRKEILKRKRVSKPRKE